MQLWWILGYGLGWHRPLIPIGLGQGLHSAGKYPGTRKTVTANYQFLATGPKEVMKRNERTLRYNLHYSYIGYLAVHDLVHPLRTHAIYTSCSNLSK